MKQACRSLVAYRIRLTTAAPKPGEHAAAVARRNPLAQETAVNMAALRQSLVGIRALRSLSVARVAAARGYADAPAEKITLTLSAPHTVSLCPRPQKPIHIAVPYKWVLWLLC